MQDEYGITERARRALHEYGEAAMLFGLLCVYWVAMSISDQWLKFRAALAERRARMRVVPKRDGIVQAYTDLELIIRTGGSYGGQRAVFITELARMEDELLDLRLEVAVSSASDRLAAIERRDADEAMRREEASRTANR